MASLETAGALGGVLFLAWIAGRLALWVLAQLAAPTHKELEAHLAQQQVDAGINETRARERAARVADQMAHEVRPIEGHCLHAPKCIGKGEPDERDPLGCCNCGTREHERGSGTRPTTKEGA